MSLSSIRNRITKHVRIRAGDLVPHERNPRLHPEVQRRALLALYAEIGFARSLLAFELPDGRLKLIDGHLRQKLDPDMIVEVEVLDVSEEEAHKLLLSIDPLSTLVEHDHARLEELRQITKSDNDDLNNLWRTIAAEEAETLDALEKARRDDPRLPDVSIEQYLILIECPDEQTQLELLERFQAEGLSCRALLS
jgi:hypothetical protein